MAGTTTAARSAWGVIASSEDMNPTMNGDYLNSLTNASGNFAITSIPTTDWQDLEIWFNKSNQSTWTADWRFYFNYNATDMNSTYWYRGHSTGAGYGYNSQSQAYMYPEGYSNYGHFLRIYLANYSSNTNNKVWWSQGGYMNGTATSYGTVQWNCGVLNITSPITSFVTSDSYNNGSSNYQAWTILGRGAKQ